MRQDNEQNPSLAETLEQCQAALRATRLENLRLSERVRKLQSRVAPGARAAALTIRWHSGDNAIFLDDAYLVRGVAGAILWKLMQTYVQSGRRAFTNVELRLAPDLRLPARNHNLEVRLSMLEQRLAELGAGVQLDRSVRGHLTLEVRPRIVLRGVDDAAPRVCRGRARVPSRSPSEVGTSWLPETGRDSAPFTNASASAGETVTA